MTISREKLTQVVQKVSPHGRLLRTWPLKGGLSAEIIALEIEEANGQTKKLIMRQLGMAHNDTNPHPLATEFRTLQLTHARGLPAPQPYLFDDSGEILTTPYLLLAYADGAMDFAPPNLVSVISFSPP